jgi:hypothetical protein
LLRGVLFDRLIRRDGIRRFDGGPNVSLRGSAGHCEGAEYGSLAGVGEDGCALGEVADSVDWEAWCMAGWG